MNRSHLKSAVKSNYTSIVRSKSNWKAILLGKNSEPEILELKFWGIQIEFLTAKIVWIPLDEYYNSYYSKSNFVCLSYIVDLNESLLFDINNKCLEKAKQLESKKLIPA
jgi:hypothetical protein